ncbi:glycosyltransferase [Candidatus Margulisiibacteriota bacterium]
MSAKISFCLISRNNEKTIEDTLASIKNVADEIIVVDTGSTDKTEAIVNKFTKNIFHFKWIDDFAAARNESIKHAKHDWIFIIDADEVLDPSSIENIKNALKTASQKKITAYQCLIHNVRGEQLYSINYMVRMLRKLDDKPFVGRIHERTSPKYKIAKSGIKIIHTGYDPSLKLPHKEAEKREKLLELDLKDNPEDINAIYNLANQYLSNKNYEKSLELLDKALAKEPNNLELLITKADLLREQNGFASSVSILEKLLNIKEGQYLDLRPYFILGDVFYRQKKYAEALKLYKDVFAFTPEDLVRQDVTRFDIPTYFYALFQACYMASVQKEYQRCFKYGETLLNSPFYQEQTIYLLFLTAIEAKDNKILVELYEKYQEFFEKHPKAITLKGFYLQAKNAG